MSQAIRYSRRRLNRLDFLFCDYLEAESQQFVGAFIVVAEPLKHLHQFSDSPSFQSPRLVAAVARSDVLHSPQFLREILKIIAVRRKFEDTEAILG